MELIFLEYFFPRLIPHKVKIALSGRYYWKLLNALGQYYVESFNLNFPGEEAGGWLNPLPQL